MKKRKKNEFAFWQPKPFPPLHKTPDETDICMIEMPTDCLAYPDSPTNISLTRETLKWLADYRFEYGCQLWTENGVTKRYIRFWWNMPALEFLRWRTSKGDGRLLLLPGACVDEERIDTRGYTVAADFYNYSLRDDVKAWLDANAPGYNFYHLNSGKAGIQFFINFAEDRHYVLFKLMWV